MSSKAREQFTCEDCLLYIGLNALGNVITYDLFMMFSMNWCKEVAILILFVLYAVISYKLLLIA